MRIIIAGSRGINSPTCARVINQKETCFCIQCNAWRLDLIRFAMKWSNLFRAEIDCIVSGEATGMDEAGMLWAVRNRLQIDRHSVDWKRYKKRAGYVRNLEMLGAADWLVAIWNGKSKGTCHIIQNAKRRGKKVFVLKVDTGGRKKWYGDGYSEETSNSKPVKGCDGHVPRGLLD